jgi:hypothetical protein
MIMMRPAVLTIHPWDFHFRAVLLISPCRSRSSLKGTMTWVDAVTCIRSDSVKNRSRFFRSTKNSPFTVHRCPLTQCWSTGVLEYWVFFSLRHYRYSITDSPIIPTPCPMLHAPCPMPPRSEGSPKRHPPGKGVE